MSKLIFDIETYGYSGDKLDPVIAESLTKEQRVKKKTRDFRSDRIISCKWRNCCNCSFKS